MVNPSLMETYRGCNKPFYDEDSEDTSWSSPFKYAVINNNKEIIDTLFENYQGDLSNDNYFCDDLKTMLDISPDIDETADLEITDACLTTFSCAILFSDSYTLEKILNVKGFELAYEDKIFLNYLDWSTVSEASKKRSLIEEKTSYKFSPYNGAYLKNKKENLKQVWQRESKDFITEENVKSLVNDYINSVFNENFKERLGETADQESLFDTMIKSTLFIMYYEVNKEKNKLDEYKWVIQKFTEYNNMTYYNIASSLIDEEYSLDFVESQIIELYHPMFTVFATNIEMDYKTEILDAFINILKSWLKVISNDKQKRTDFMSDVINEINKVDYKEIINESNNFETIEKMLKLKMLIIIIIIKEQNYYL